MYYSAAQQLTHHTISGCAMCTGDLLGSGTVGSGCLLEVRESTLGRYLAPGDEVTLAVERLGSLHTPIVARPIS